MSVTPVIEATDITMVYKTRRGFSTQTLRAVNNFSVAIAPGEIVALVGESGSGKSTIGRILLRTIAPTHGSVRLDGHEITSRSHADQIRYWRHVQLIFQDPFAALNPANTIKTLLSRPLINYLGLRGAALDSAVHNLLHQVGLTPPESYLSKFSYQLSGGQKQRVVIARALASRPKVIIADEPISMLDVSIKAGILSLMTQIRDEFGLSYLYITHDLTSAYHVADRIIVLYGGTKMEEGTADQVVNHPQHPYTKMLLASVPNPFRTDPLVPLPTENATIVSRGCPFAKRCPLVQDICLETIPEPTVFSPGHLVACHAVHPQKEA